MEDHDGTDHLHGNFPKWMKCQKISVNGRLSHDTVRLPLDSRGAKPKGLPVMNIPQRKSLLFQSVDILRQSLSDGVWQEHLPGERELSRLLHVSRPTVRSALEILGREKLIENSPGRLRRILVKRKPRAPKKATLVTMISKNSLHEMSRNRLFLFNFLNRSLQEHNIRLELVSHEGFGFAHPFHALKLIEKTRSDAYVLALTSQRVQEWFVQTGRPALILGSAFPGVGIPSLESDYHALGRHAAGTLLGKGHQKIALVAPSQPLAGDTETELAFSQEIDRRNREDKSLCCRIIKYAPDPADLLTQWQKIQQSESRVTAVFALYPSAALAILNRLLVQQIAVPEQISILSRDGDPLYRWIQPRISHYCPPLTYFAGRLSSLVMDLLDAGCLPLSRTNIMPELQPGESLGHPPALKAGSARSKGRPKS
jgi:DNA-binding LacI/PurR family transcriptional regulator